MYVRSFLEATARASATPPTDNYTNQLSTPGDKEDGYTGESFEDPPRPLLSIEDASRTLRAHWIRVIRLPLVLPRAPPFQRAFCCFVCHDNELKVNYRCDRELGGASSRPEDESFGFTFVYRPA